MLRVAVVAFLCALTSCGGCGGGGSDGGTEGPYLGMRLVVSPARDSVNIEYHPTLDPNVPSPQPANYCPALSGTALIDARDIPLLNKGGVFQPFPPCNLETCDLAVCNEPYWVTPTDRSLPEDFGESAVTVFANDQIWTMVVPHLYGQRVLRQVSPSAVAAGGTLVLSWTPPTDVMPAFPDLLGVWAGEGLSAETLPMSYDAGVVVISVPADLPPGRYEYNLVNTALPMPHVSQCDGLAVCDVESALPALFCSLDGVCDAGIPAWFTVTP